MDLYFQIIDSAGCFERVVASHCRRYMWRLMHAAKIVVREMKSDGHRMIRILLEKPILYGV